MTMARSLSVDEAMREAARLARSGNVDGAKHLYNQILARNPAHKKAKRALRDLQGGSGAALTQADFERVALLMRDNRMDSANTEIRRLCRLHPEQPALHNLRGVILNRRGEKEAALEAFQTAIRQKPDFHEAINNLASTLSDLGRTREALNLYQQLVNQGAADAEVYANTGRALRREGMLKEAGEAFRRAIRLNPVNPEAYRALGEVLMAQGDESGCIEAMETCIDLDPGNRNALASLGNIYYARQRHAAALKMYRRLLDLAPRDPIALAGCSQALLALGQKTAAAEMLREKLAVDADDAVSRHLLAALEGRQISESAGDYARQVFDGYAENFEQHLTGALEYSLPSSLPALLESLDGAEAWYERALDLGCGTGLVGANIRGYCGHLLGVDISPGMLEKAEQKAVYDELRASDLHEMLAGAEETFDLIVSADVLVYIGALDRLLALAAARCNPGARIIISTEQLDEGDYRLLETGRFAHSRDYVERCAQAAGLTVERSETVDLRRERGFWLKGGVFVLKRG
jgi:predicted TPR repeat methyltransferase